MQYFLETNKQTKRFFFFFLQVVRFQFMLCSYVGNDSIFGKTKATDIIFNLKMKRKLKWSYPEH